MFHNETTQAGVTLWNGTKVHCFLYVSFLLIVHSLFISSDDPYVL